VEAFERCFKPEPTNFCTLFDSLEYFDDVISVAGAEFKAALKGKHNEVVAEEFGTLGHALH